MPEQPSGISNINPAGDKKSKRKVFWYWSLVIIAAMVAATLVLVNALKPEDVGLNSIKSKPRLESTVTEIPFGMLPVRFPADMPLEKDATVLKNFEDYNDNKTVQATREFITTEPLDKSYASFEKYFKENGWTISSQLNQSDIKVISAVSENRDRIQITFSKGATGIENTINITLIYYNLSQNK